MRDLANKVAMELNERGYEAIVIETVKNNCTMTGVTVRGNGERIAPTFYMKSFEGDEFEIADKMEELYEEHRDSIDVDVNNFLDWDWVKERLETRVVNASNKDAFDKANRIYREELDLLISPYVNLGEDIRGTLTVAITSDHIKNWNVDADELIDVAIENSKFVDPVFSQDMNDFMRIQMTKELEAMAESMGCSVEDLMPPMTRCEMVVLSSQSKNNGARYMLDVDVLKSVSEKFFDGENMYIIPSSIHEVFCVRQDSVSEEDLKGMIGDVNANEVELTEQLSDHPYIYEDGTLR